MMKPCPKHPKQRLNRKPKHECSICAGNFLSSRSGVRAPIIKTKIKQSKKVYKRSQDKKVRYRD